MNTQAIAPAIMQNLVAVVESGALMTTSLKVADAFGKRHDNLLRKIETLGCSTEFNALNFEAVEYLDLKGETRKAWNMTKDGFMFLVMGFTGTKAATIKEAYIAEFNRMADEIHRRELATLVDDIPFPPVASELHKCSGQQLAKALCHKLGATRYMLSIEPDSGSMSGRHGGDSLTLWPVADCAHVIDPTDPRDMQRMLDLMSNDDLTDLMKLTLASVTRRTKSLMQPR
ncbi:Rha family transcriptional regulator [Aeromonas sp. PrichA-15]|uniref:Rha family transcriptional regulator n=1 Tax=Aeromonas sp. PrichA-15 TaxID=2823360 RepID=UPI001B33AF0A|nr:Rha family transcriptional regulator [Aeromonas sp. PrichA-15]MBP4034381.1 Rha family transcriptional regulator [Aeromonas sp. PrichA-15]